MSKSFIFLQASLKMSAVLNCYEAEKAKGRDVSIILPSYLANTKAFIEKLQLKASVFILDGFVWKHALLYFFVYRRRIKKNLSQIGVDDNSRFYFTDVNEGIIGLLLPFLKKCAPTQILTKQDVLDGPNYQIEYKSSNMSKIIKAKLLSFFYCTHFIAANEYGSEQLWTDRKAYNLPMIDFSDTSIINKYRVKVTNSPNSVIFYTSPYNSLLYEKNEYDKINKEIVTVLHQKGYKVYIKNHPVLKMPNTFNGLTDEIIPSYIPGEYLELSNFIFAIGFFSVTIATASEVIPSYSVLKVWDVKDVDARDFYVKYLKDYNSKVTFLSSLEDIPDYNEY